MKKILSLILVLALMMSFGTVAFAEGEESTTNAAQELVDAAAPGETVTLPENSEISTGGAVLNADDANITIDLNGSTVTVGDPTVGSSGTETLGFQLLEESEKTTITDGTIIFSEVDDLKMGIQNYNDLELNNVELVGSDNTQYVVSNNQGDVLIQDSTITAAEGQVAFDVFDYASGGYDGVSVTVDGEDTVITGIVEVGGTAAKGEEDATLVIENGTFKNFILKIQQGYESGVHVNGGQYSFGTSSNEADVDTADELKLYIPTTHEIVQSGGYWVVQLIVVNEATGEATTVAVPVPVVTGGVAETEYVEVEVNGETVHFWIDSGFTRTEEVAPVVTGAGEDVVLGIFVDPTSFSMEMSKVIEAYEALVPSAVVSVKDGETIDAADYEFEFTEDGMISIKLAPEVLEALGAGTHTIVVEFAGMAVEFHITVV